MKLHRVCDVLAVLGLLFMAAAIWDGLRVDAQQVPTSSLTIFDPDPNHIWNRTYACLFVRHGTDGTAYGMDSLDPLLWEETRHLLIGSSHRRALTCLDEFLEVHAERMELDPAKRAVYQHDLWAIFDWVAAGDDLPQERRELETRLAEIIRRLALTSEEIRGLPDTYAVAEAAQGFARAYDPQNPRQPFLPPDLFRSDGPWVCLSAYSEKPTAIVHFSGRSRFLVFMRLPAGRDATAAYVRGLRTSSEPPVLRRGSRHVLLNLALPQFPVGTQVALVRQAILIDDKGKLEPTTLTESVQLRVYHAITPGTQGMNYINGPSSRDQDFFEFRMSRPELFAHRLGGLVAVRQGDTEYATFSTHGTDAFESMSPNDRPSVILQTCRSCHSDSGIHSVQSRIQWMKRPPSGDESHRDPISWETKVTLARKQQEAAFKLLQRLWHHAQK